MRTPGYEKSKRYEQYRPGLWSHISRPWLFLPAGFPSPADDFLDKRLDLNEYLIKHPAATFYVRVHGDSMVRAGIQSGDILVVDRSLEPQHRRVVVAFVDGEFTVKRLLKRDGGIVLAPENPAYPEISIKPGMEMEVWGVVTAVIHELL